MRSNSPRRRQWPVLCEPIEPLESRLLLSTITWVNRGQASDNFDSVFGSNAAAARAVIDTVISHWERVITSFNYPSGNHAYSLTLYMDPTGTDSNGESNPTHWDGNKPDAGWVKLGRGTDTEPAPGDGLGDGGDDTLYVGGPGGNVDNVAGSVIFDGGNGHDVMYYGDSSGDFRPDFTYTVTGSYIARSSGPTAYYSQCEGVTVSCSYSSETVNILSTAANTPVTVYGNGGDNIFAVTPTSHVFNLGAPSACTVDRPAPTC